MNQMEYKGYVGEAYQNPETGHWYIVAESEETGDNICSEGITLDDLRNNLEVDVDWYLDAIEGGGF